MRQDEVMQLLRSRGPMTATEIAEEFYDGKVGERSMRSTARLRLKSLQRAGYVRITDEYVMYRGENKAYKWEAVE